MATQEEINEFVEKEMQERAIQAKINNIETVTPEDLEKEKDAEITAAHEAYLEVYRDHSKITREEYKKAADPLIAAWKSLISENEAIKERNQTKITSANTLIIAEKATLEKQLIDIKTVNEEVFKDIAITATTTNETIEAVK